GNDQIYLAGTSTDYALTVDHAGLPEGTAIWLKEDGGSNELIAIANGDTSLDLGSSDFFYVDDLIA
ncbi:MAG: hypothetical protein GY788_03740, partial [bacterium]|nr:hypothetical protein [bacterium]